MQSIKLDPNFLEAWAHLTQVFSINKPHNSLLKHHIHCLSCEA